MGAAAEEVATADRAGKQNELWTGWRLMRLSRRKERVKYGLAFTHYI